MKRHAANRQRPDSLRSARRRWWLILWVSAAVWLLAFAGSMRGWWDLVVLGLVSVIVLAAMGWSNHRLTLMERRRERGCCWSCGYDLRGSDPARCSECGQLQ